MSELYPIEWVVLFSIPLFVWAAVAVVLHWLARKGRLAVRINLLAFLGALLGFAALMTAYVVRWSGYDVSMTWGYSLFLLFTYPLSLVTPLASIGQTGILLYTMAFAIEKGASIEPMYGYFLAWISVALMFASMLPTVGPGIDRKKPTVSCRLLTMTAKRLKDKTKTDTDEAEPTLSPQSFF